MFTQINKILVNLSEKNSTASVNKSIIKDKQCIKQILKLTLELLQLRYTATQLLC